MLAAIRNRRLRRQSCRGVTAIEYGIIAAAIIVAIIGVLRVTGTDLEAVFGRVGNGMAGATKTASQVVFGTFETITGAGNTGFCQGYPISGFANSGGVISLNGCGDSQSTVYSDLTSNTLTNGYGDYAIISNPASGQPITVPPLQGPGTGFTIPANGHVFLFKTQSGSGHSFRIYNYNGGFNATNTASAKAACAAESGTFSFNSAYGYCNGGHLYTGTEIAAALPPQ